MPPRNQSRVARLLTAGALALPALLLHAQESDDTLVMQPFQVTSAKSNDYIASESVTGTRVVSKLRDLPFQVNVVTNEFMMDYAAFELPEQLAFVSNVSPSDSQGTLSLRGFTTTPYVDGFRRLANLTISNIERVEVIKGPSASIYGQVLPGGLVNYISKRPSDKASRGIDVSYGSLGFFRASAYATGPFGNRKLMYRFDYSEQSRNFEQVFADRRTTYFSGMLLYRPDAQTNINFKVDYNRTYNHDPQSIPWVKSSTKGYVLKADGTPLQYGYISDPVKGTIKYVNAPYFQVVDRYTNAPEDVAAYKAFLADPTKYNNTFIAKYGQFNTTNSWDRLDTSLTKLRTDGYLGYTSTTTTSATLTADRHVSDLYSVRATIDGYNRPWQRQSNSGNQVYYTDPNYTDGEVGLSTPTFRLNPRNGFNTQLDNLFSFKTGKVAHKLLFTIDYAYQAQKDFSRYALSSGSYWRDASGAVYKQADGQIYTGSTSPGTGYTKYNVLPDSYYTVSDPMSGLLYPFYIPLGPKSVPSTANGVITWPYSKATWLYPTYSSNPESYTQLRTNNETSNDDLGLFMSERATFFKGRLIALVGGRYDTMKNKATNLLNSGGAQNINWNNHAFTYQAGLTGYVTSNIVLFANKSTTYNPNPQYKQYADGSFEVFPNEKGEGYEFGTRFVLFNQKLNIGLSRFVIDRKNKLDSWTDEFGVTQYIASGEQRSAGYEVDMNWQVTDGLQFLGGYGYNDATYTKSTLPYLIGTTTPQSAKDNFGMAARYVFRKGFLKGVALNANVTYVSRSLVSVGSGGVITTNPFAKSGFKKSIFNVPLYSGTLPFPTLPRGLAILSRNSTASKDSVSGLSNNNAGKGYTDATVPANWILYTAGMTMDSGKQYYVWDGDGLTSASYKDTTTVDDGRMNVFNQPYTLWGFGVSYTFRTQGNALRHTVRFNIKNAFDKFYTYGGGALGDRAQYIGTYSLAF